MPENALAARRAPSAVQASLCAVAALVLREMSTRYARTPGGYLWAIPEPLGLIVILGLVFYFWPGRPLWEPVFCFSRPQGS